MLFRSVECGEGSGGDDADQTSSDLGLAPLSEPESSIMEETLLLHSSTEEEASLSQQLSEEQTLPLQPDPLPAVQPLPHEGSESCKQTEIKEEVSSLEGSLVEAEPAVGASISESDETNLVKSTEGPKSLGKTSFDMVDKLTQHKLSATVEIFMEELNASVEEIKEDDNVSNIVEALSFKLDGFISSLQSNAKSLTEIDTLNLLRQKQTDLLSLRDRAIPEAAAKFKPPKMEAVWSWMSYLTESVRESAVKHISHPFISQEPDNDSSSPIHWSEDANTLLDSPSFLSDAQLSAQVEPESEIKSAGLEEVSSIPAQNPLRKVDSIPLLVRIE